MTQIDVKYLCPQCKSANVSSCRMIHANGNATSSGSISSISSRIYSSTSTTLASWCAPPSPPKISLHSLGCAITAIVPICAIVTSIISSVHRNEKIIQWIFQFPWQWQDWLPGGLIVVALYVRNLVKNSCHKRQMEAHEKKMTDWRKRWICLRCGHTYQPLL